MVASRARVDRGRPPGLGPVVACQGALHASLWDPGVGLDRLAPGTTPGLDLRGFDLHSVRDSALGAFGDLGAGEPERAARTIEAVLAQQYRAPGRPWDATFRVTAEQDDPPGDEAVEWLHYDPNWRQFIGSILALTLEEHEARLPPALVPRVVEAIEAAVRREPEGRIPDWYTNPALMHAWLQGWVGRRVGAPGLVAAGRAGAERTMARLARHGDVDEYSSPTYDGVDLYAAALWNRHPASDEEARWGETLLVTLGRRIGRLFHPGLGAMCGPYIRAYGLGLDRYVSLLGLWLVAAGVPPEDVLPPAINDHTVHVHDLAFAPLFAALAPTVVPHLVLATDLPRRHEQRFGPVEAVSVLGPDWATGAERGRRPIFSREQYVPVTVHAREPGPDAAVRWVGLGLGAPGTTVDAVADGRGAVDVAVGHEAPSGPVSVRLLWSARPTGDGDGDGARLGPVTVSWSTAPTSITEEGDARGWWATLVWDGPTSLVLSAAT